MEGLRKKVASPLTFKHLYTTIYENTESERKTMKKIETERLILRDWDELDLDDMYTIVSNPTINKTMGTTPVTTKDKCHELLQYLIEKRNNYAMELKENHKVIGMIGINKDAMGHENTRNLGFSVSEEFQGKGLLSEALAAIIPTAKEYAEYLSATHIENNEISKHILLKFGFKQIGITQNVYRSADTEPHSEPYYVLQLKST